MTLRRIGTSLLLLCSLVMAPSVAAETEGQGKPQAKVTRLLTQALPEYPGKEATMFLVEYPPGGADPVHRHDAYAFVYVLEGSVVMGVKGGKELTLTPGQTFQERPNDVHTVGRNASKTQPAKFLVVMLKKEGAPVLLPVK